MILASILKVLTGPLRWLWAALAFAAGALVYGAAQRRSGARDARYKIEREAVEARLGHIKEAQEIEGDVEAMDDDRLCGALLDRVRRSERP